MNDSFEYTVDEIEEIHGLVEELNKRAESGIYQILMDHQEEKNAVRGQREPLRYENEDLPESKRKDGGLTWYHDPDTSKCLMLGQPNEETKNNEEIMNYWGSLITECLEQIGYDATQFGADIYDKDGNQLVGLSGYNEGDTTVVRACWYEDKPEDKPEIDEFLEADGVDKKEWYDSMESVGGLYEHLKDNIDFEEVGKDFISDESFERATEYMFEREGGGRKGTCILGETE